MDGLGSNGSDRPSSRCLYQPDTPYAPEQQNPELIARGITECNRLFAIVDAELTRKSWLGDETFGLADIALGPMIYNLFSLDIAWNEVPHLQRWYQQLTQRPAFQKKVMIGIS